MWISDSTLHGGYSPPTVGYSCAAWPFAGRFARCSFNPPFAPCNYNNVPVTGPLLGVTQIGALQSPGSLQVDFTTEANQLVGVFVSTGAGNTTIPGLEQSVLLDLATMFPLTLLTTNSGGFATGTWNVPPGLTNQTLFLKAVGTASVSGLLQTSPVAGGVVN